MSSFDDFIIRTGQLGRYQKLLILVAALVQMPISFNTYLPMVTLYIPKHRCALESYPGDTYAVQSPSHASLINRSIPRGDDGEMSSCRVFGHHDECSLLNETFTCDPGNTSEVDSVVCRRWVFDHKYFDHSVIEELEIGCDRQHWRSHANMAMMIGKMVGELVQAFIGDTLGRRKTLCFFIVVLTGGTFANAFTFNLPSLIAFRFIDGFSTAGTFTSCFVLSVEFIGLKYRTFMSLILYQVFTLGDFYMAGLAYVLRDFTNLGLVLGVLPFILSIAIIMYMPESPRWLICRGRKKEAREIMTSMSKVNNAHFPEDVFERMLDQTLEGEEQKTTKVANKGKRNETFLNVFGQRKLAVRFAIVCCNWLASFMMQFGIIFNVLNIGGSLYLNLCLAWCVDLLANFVLCSLAARFGRKRVHLLSLLLAVLACLSAIVPTVFTFETDLITVVISLFGRFGACLTFNGLYLYTAEMFPTTARSSAMGLAQMVGRVGAISSIYVADLGLLIGGDLSVAFPLLVFGAAGLLAFVLALFLPETGNKKLSDTIQDEVLNSRPPTKDTSSPVFEMTD